MTGNIRVMKLGYLFSIIIILLVSGCEKKKNISKSVVKNTDTTTIPTDTFRKKYEGKYNVMIVEAVYGYPTYGFEEDTTYYCVLVVTVPPPPADSVSFYGPDGEVRYPAVFLEKEDKTRFYFYQNTQTMQTCGIDTSGHLVLQYGTFISNRDGFVANDSIRFEMNDSYPKLNRIFRITGRKI